MLLPLGAGLIAGLAVYGLARTTRGTPTQRAGRQWVEFGLPYKLLAIGFFPLSAFVTYAAANASADQRTLAGIIALCFWLGTLYLAYGFFFVWLSYDDEFVYHETPLRKRRIPWGAVSGVTYSPGTQAFALTTDGFGSISVSPLADGAQALVERAGAAAQTEP